MKMMIETTITITAKPVPIPIQTLSFQEHPFPFSILASGHFVHVSLSIEHAKHPAPNVQFTHPTPLGKLYCFPETHSLHSNPFPLGSDALKQ